MFWHCLRRETVQNALLNESLGVEGQKDEEEADAELEHIARVRVKSLPEATDQKTNDQQDGMDRGIRKTNRKIIRIMPYSSEQREKVVDQSENAMENYNKTICL